MAKNVEIYGTRKKIPVRQMEGRIYFYQRMDQRNWECDRALRQAKEA